MLLKNRFKIIQTLHENDSTIIYRAIQLTDNKNVIIKKLKQSSRDEHKINQFINENRILSKLKTNNIIEILDVISEPSIYCHILEDIGGESLYSIILKHRFSLEEGLDIALLSMKTLQYLHKNHIVHADINPKNIIYNVKTRALQVIDFGISVKEEDILLGKKKTLNSSGNLLYISPEQTGLTKHKLDYRSDIYSLGMSLYHIFLGEIPLKTNDQYELIHKQMVLTPKLLHEADINIPKALSLIIDKMIKKDPNKRYQNDNSILYDLQKCIQTLDKNNNIKYFKIASLDRPSIQIGTILFGRDKELLILKNALKNINEAPLRLLITGEIGSGKTRLVNEFLHLLDTKKFNVLTGKYDKYKGYLPYVGYRQIFSSLDTIFTIKSIQTYVKKMHRDTSKILTMFFPELNHLFSTKTRGHDIADLLYTKEQLSFAIKDLLKAIATKEKPLIIFFDDLQWIDQASAQMLKTSILNNDNPYISFIGTFRNSKDNMDIVSEVITEFSRNQQYESIKIKLKNLLKEDVNKMIKTLLIQNLGSLNSLASVIYKKTDGNPFYIKTFIEFLLDKKALYFEDGIWKYSISKIDKYNQSDNIIDLIRLKLNKLNKEEKSYLQYLSILGNKFNLKLTLEIMQHHGYMPSTMKNVIKDGFINVYAGTYQFSHDIIQQDIFLSLHKKTSYEIHKNIGIYLEKAYKAYKYHDIIIVAYHLNRAYPPSKAPQRLFKLNIMSIKRIINNNSYSLALSKIEWIDKTFFNDEIWNKNHTMAFEYSLLKVKTLYLNAKLTSATKQLTLLIAKTKTTKERLLCFSLLKDISVTRGTYFKQTLEFGNQLFEELNMITPKTKGELSLMDEKIDSEISSHYLFNNPHELLKHKRLQNNKIQSISSLLVEYWEIAYYLADVELMKWCFLNIIQLSFKYGNSAESAFGYVLYGSYLISQKEYKKARLFGEIALKLNSMFSDTKMLPKIYNFVANFINPYTKRLNTNIKLYKKSLQQSTVDGNIVFGTWANFLMHFSNYLSGESLEKVVSSINNESEFILNSGDEKMIGIFNILKSTINELQNQGIKSSKYNKKIIQMWENEKFYPALAWYGIIKAQQCFITGKIENGLKFLDLYIHSELNDIILFSKINFHFIRALLLLHTNRELGEHQKKQLTYDLDKINTYYKTTPFVFRFYKLLLDAQCNKDKESVWDIAKKYDRAINQAKKDKNSFFIAIANLSASRFWENLEYLDMKGLYLNEAISNFNQWGAYNIARKLKTKINETTTKFSTTLNTSSSSRVKQSNFRALIKSYNAISQSKSTIELIDTFMKIILQNATASSGVLILKEKKEFFIKATMDYAKDKFEFINEELDTYNYLPKSTIKSVITSGRNLVLNQPSQSGKFQFDKYFKEHEPASIIIIPMKVEGDVAGILYLQNNEISANLSRETIKTLELLLTQVAIVFKNITLYENLKINDKNLNKAQELLNVGSWQLDFSVNEILWSAETYRIFDIEPFSTKIDYGVFLSYLHPDDLKDFTRAKNKAIKESSLCDIEHRIITDKGNIKFVKQKAEIYMQNGIKRMSGTIQDITKTKRAQEQIATLSQVIEQSPSSIVITDTSGNIEYTNKQFTKNTGYFKAEVIGSNMNIFNSKKHSVSFYEDLWNSILIEKQIWRGVIVDKVKNQKFIDFDTTIFPILNSKEKAIHLVAIQEDVTEKNIHDKLFLMQTRQAQMGEMISMIAHQWRQPLGAISATAIGLQMHIRLQSYDLDTKEGQEKQSEYFLKQLKKIEEFVLGLSSTIDDFRNFYKPNKLPIKSTLKNIVSKALNIIRTSLKNHNITLIEKYNSTDEIDMYDSEMIQVILNILKNAQDAFEDKNVPKATITITTNKRTILISDNAGGIPKDIIGNIFEVYFSTKNEKNGTGLGLYMSKTIVERHHNGKLSVKNIDDGACFSIKIGKTEAIR